MFELEPKQSRSVIIVALLLYVATMTGLFAWLAFKGEETVQERIEQTPSVTVTLAGKEPLVPDSWKKDAKTPAEEKLPATQPRPEEAQQTPQPEQKAAEEKLVGQDASQQTETPIAKEQEAPAAETAQQPEAVAPAQTSLLRWQRFARPFDQANVKPRISIIVTNLGLAVATTQTAVQGLPGEISLAFSSSAPDLETWIAKARAAGHEAILTVPMEPEGYPQNDPGPNTLLTGLDEKENVSRARWALARADGYVGVMPYMGTKFVTFEDKMAPVLDVVKEQGLMIIDGTQNVNSVIPQMSRLASIPFVRSNAVIDLTASDTPIEIQFEQLEKTALERGYAVGIALPYPVTFEKLKAWLPSLEQKGLVLAPITAVASSYAPAAAPMPTPEKTEETQAAASPAAATATAPSAPAEPDPNRANNEIVQ